MNIPMNMCRDNRGEAAISFTIMGMMLATLLAFSVDLGRATYDRMSLASAVRSGLQVALADSLNTPRVAATVAAASTLSGPAPTVTVRTFCECSGGATNDCSSTCPGSAPLRFVEVTATRPFEKIFPLSLVPGQLTAVGTIRTQ